MRCAANQLTGSSNDSIPKQTGVRMADVVKEVENNEKFADKRLSVTEKLKKREEERQADVNKRKEEKETSSVAHEKVDFFRDNFNIARAKIETHLAQAETCEKSKLSDHFDDLILSLQKLEKFVTDSSMFVTSYDMQKAQESMASLMTAIQATREKLIPKKKFAFKSKKKTEIKAKPALHPTDVTDGPQKPSVVVTSEKLFENVNGKDLEKRGADINRKDISLVNLVDCTIKLYGTPSTLHLSNMVGCTVLSGPVSTSIFIDKCVNCTFVVPCQQLRCHSTVDSHFYLHVTSRAIIEDCKGLCFAPYTWDYDEIEEHYAMSGLDKMRNNWNDVDDFNWLASDVHSPNWCILEDVKRQRQF